MPPALFDCGANLADTAFRADLDAVLERARRAGVARIAITGSSLESSRAALEIAAKQSDWLCSTAGIHPHHSGDASPEALQELAGLLASPHCRLAGEMGLDYFRDFAPRTQQRKAFEAQLALAAEAQCSTFLHVRDAFPDFLPMIREWRDKVPNMLVHCFTGTEAELRACLDLDCHIGITGWLCDERRGSHLPELLQDIPENRLVAETDAPYLLPRDLRPKPKSRRCEPVHLAHIVARITEHSRGRHTAETLWRNSMSLFGYPSPDIETV